MRRAGEIEGVREMKKGRGKRKESLQFNKMVLNKAKHKSALEKWSFDG